MEHRLGVNMKRHLVEASGLVQRGLGAHRRSSFGPETILKYQIAVLFAAALEAALEVSWTRTKT